MIRKHIVFRGCVQGAGSVIARGARRIITDAPVG